MDEERLADLLCAACSKQRADHAEDQRRLDNLRKQAILAEYRGRPYAERRLTREWAMLNFNAPPFGRRSTPAFAGLSAFQLFFALTS